MGVLSHPSQVYASSLPLQRRSYFTICLVISVIYLFDKSSVNYPRKISMHLIVAPNPLTINVIAKGIVILNQLLSSCYYEVIIHTNKSFYTWRRKKMGKFIYEPKRVEVVTIEKAINETHKIKSKWIQRALTTATICLINATTLLAETTEPLQESNPLSLLGEQFIGLAQQLGVYVAVAMCLFEVAKALLEGDPKRIPGLVAKYAIGVLAIWSVPMLFGAIGAPFKH